jgi:[NiFe] hydrogenase assembly HybE family chaperone
VAELPDPSAALQARFQAIHRDAMQGLPMLNEMLAVRALGFRHWQGFWLGVLITPWFMNLVLMPRQREQWPAVGERETRDHVFPAGVFEFIGARDTELGDYQACSLFSPMFDFSDQASAEATALAALSALFDAANGPGAAPALPAPPGKHEPGERGSSKREFMFGGQRRSDHGP